MRKKSSKMITMQSSSSFNPIDQKWISWFSRLDRILPYSIKEMNYVESFIIYPKATAEIIPGLGAWSRSDRTSKHFIRSSFQSKNGKVTWFFQLLYYPENPYNEDSTNVEIKNLPNFMPVFWSYITLLWSR